MISTLAMIALATLSIGGESRMRFEFPTNASQQGLYRGVIGADLRPTPATRLYAELGTAQAAGKQGTAGANFQNQVALQQLFLDARRQVGPWVLGGTAGRQELAEGPRQLVSVGDGPNLHRTWNGLRLYAEGEGLRLGAFGLFATRLGAGAFDDPINPDERLAGLTGSWQPSPALALEPFVLRSENAGADARTTSGLRLRAAQGRAGVDAVLARQVGRAGDRDADAWGLFVAPTLALDELPARPRLGLRLDLATGGSDGPRPTAGFHPLYASSNYLGDGLFLSTSNLVLLTPSLALAPTPTTGLTLSYGFAYRASEADAAYAGLMRPYPGTQGVSGHELGGLLRVAGSWEVGSGVTLGASVEHFAAGAVLQQAGLPGGSYATASTTFKF